MGIGEHLSIEVLLVRMMDDVFDVELMGGCVVVYVRIYIVDQAADGQVVDGRGQSGGTVRLGALLFLNLVVTHHTTLLHVVHVVLYVFLQLLLHPLAPGYTVLDVSVHQRVYVRALPIPLYTAIQCEPR